LGPSQLAMQSPSPVVDATQVAPSPQPVPASASQPNVRHAPPGQPPNASRKQKLPAGHSSSLSHASPGAAPGSKHAPSPAAPPSASHSRPLAQSAVVVQPGMQTFPRLGSVVQP